MKLLRLEMKGFKSFARETVIHFNERITGVVGPNGSGKSNVVDAIRWVLGEQKSSELRLEKMGDILFNGTQRRNPAPVARASITFENDKGLIKSEYSELTITRILYRSGDSEYRLNDVTCRLKDIRSVLLDTGIGSNSYAIIALGMVDDILSDKDQARRKMFEQAAGISKYKSRKRETLNKLKLTNADLDRVEDLLHELESTIKQLKRQAKRAEKYLKLKETYKSFSIDLAILHSTHTRANFKSIKKELVDVQNASTSLTAKINVKEAEVEAKKKQNLQKESSVSQNQRDLSGIVREIQSLENKRDITQQSISYGQQSVKRLKRQIEDNEQKIQTLAQQIENLEGKLEQEQTALEQQKEARAQLKQKKNQSQQSYQEIKLGRNSRIKELQNIQQREYEWKQKLAVLESQKQDASRQWDRLQDQLRLQKIQKQELAAAHQQQEERLVQLNKTLEQLQKTEAERKEISEKVELQKTEKRREAQELERKYDALENEFQLLKNLVEKLEGFPDSTKFLMRSNKWDVPAALFSDVLICPSEYRAALENYLERYLSHFIVSDRRDAFQGIQLLREAQKGKAQFLLNKARSATTQSEDIPQAIAASSVVETDEKYDSLITGLLHKVYLVDDENTAFQLAEEYPQFTFLVSDGSASFQQSVMSGGSSGLFEGKRLGRKKNLKRVEKQIRELKQGLDRKEQEVQHLEKEWEKIKKDEKEEEIREVQLQQAKAKNEYEKLDYQVKNIEKSQAENLAECEQLEQNQSNIQKEMTQIDNLWSTLKEEKKAVEARVEHSDSIYEDQEQVFTELSQQFNEANIRTIQQENKCAQLAKDLEYQKSRKEDVIALRSQHEIEIKELREDQVKNKQTEEKIRENLAQLYQEKEVKSKSLNEVERIYFEERNEISELEKDLKTLNQQQRQKQDLLQSLRDKHAETKMKLHGISERLKVEFDISINQIINQSPEFQGAPQELEEEVRKVKEKIQRFGDVNPMAVEAYNETNERYELMLSQKNDILEAKQKLKTTIQEIETQATQQFMEAFEKIRSNFIDVFRTLFTEGDDADLVLSDPDDPLESSVEIIAKPKGKRPKSLSQLSGGEKTLTATALLFSLYLLKPAPFCVFDEVDAPLDDANIEKFNRIIKRFSEQSQFIIVTHNKSTMAAVDIIYGVYMNEPGVSGLSPVDFRQLEHKSIMETISDSDN